MVVCGFLFVEVDFISARAQGQLILRISFWFINILAVYISVLSESFWIIFFSLVLNPLLICLPFFSGHFCLCCTLIDYLVSSTFSCLLMMQLLSLFKCLSLLHSLFFFYIHFGFPISTKFIILICIPNLTAPECFTSCRIRDK